jgi:hypothetical protein
MLLPSRSPRPHHYRSYLLRFWQDGGEPASAWRFSLEDPHTGERLGFADVNQVLAFLTNTMGQAAGNSPERT